MHLVHTGAKISDAERGTVCYRFKCSETDKEMLHYYNFNKSVESYIGKGRIDLRKTIDSYQHARGNSHISKKHTLHSVSHCSPSEPDVSGAYKVNSGSGCVRLGSFRLEVQGPHPMHLEAQVSVRMHWRRPFCVLTDLTPPGTATPLILYPQRPVSSSLRSQYTRSHAALLRTACGRDISPPGLPPHYAHLPAFFP